MKLKDYIVKLQKLADKHPNVKVVEADINRTSFTKVNFDPNVGNFGGPNVGNFGGGTFIADDGTEEFSTEYGINAVCLN